MWRGVPFSYEYSLLLHLELAFFLRLLLWRYYLSVILGQRFYLPFFILFQPYRRFNRNKKYSRPQNYFELQPPIMPFSFVIIYSNMTFYYFGFYFCSKWVIILMQRRQDLKYQKFRQGKDQEHKEERQTRAYIRPNQIVITDFSFCEAVFEKKKKRTPLFLLNKKQHKKPRQEDSIFTQSGIIATALTTMPQQNDSILQFTTTRSKSLQRSNQTAKKQSKLVPYNFIRAKTPKHITSSYKTIYDVPIFDVCLTKRYLQSAHTLRKEPAVRQKHEHRRTFSYNRPQAKPRLKDVELNELRGWNTIDVDYDEYI